MPQIHQIFHKRSRPSRERRKDRNIRRFMKNSSIDTQVATMPQPAPVAQPQKSTAALLAAAR
jgi:hypothetical protein